MKRIDFFLILLATVIIVSPLTSCQVNETQTPQEERMPTGKPTTIDLVNVMLNNTHLQVSASGLATTFPPGCKGQEPECFQAKEGKTLLGIRLIPSDLPQGDMLDYKNLPKEIAVREDTGMEAGISYRIYDVTTRILTLAFEVSGSATTFTLLWPGTDPIRLYPVQQSN